MTITEKIAEFIFSFESKDIPEEAQTRVNSALMDYVGVTLAGLHEDSAKITRTVIKGMGGNPQATIWGEDLKTSMVLAAMANGTAAHSLDLDDTNPVIMSHPSIQLLPGLFALGEYKHCAGKDIILAYITGYEMGAMLGKGLNPGLVYQGWFPVGVLGIIMQTAACTKLLGLDREKIKMALGIAANMASGLRCNNGTMAKPLIAGKVGHNGILSALLAAEGMTANPKAMEDKFGFFENFSRGELDELKMIVDSPKEPLNILQSGISVKRYPCCAGSHPAIDATLEIVKNHALNPMEIREIEVSTFSRAKFLLIYPRPENESQAKFSLEFAVARAILDGQIGPNQFQPEKIQEADLLELIEKIKTRYIESTSLEKEKQSTADVKICSISGETYTSEMERRPPTDVKIYMNTGETYSARVHQARGTAANPLSQIELEAKFDNCCSGILSEEVILGSKEQLRYFEQVQDVSDFISFLNQSILQTGNQ